MSAIDKIQFGSVPPDGGDLGCSADGFGDQYPGIFEIIATCVRKGKSRKTGKLTLTVDSGKACLCLVSKEAGCLTFYKADGFGEALEGLERQVSSGEADWRKDKWA
jgi:hypothetical protein